MRCEICGKGPPENVALIRQNPQGEKARWRCRAHTDAQMDSSADELTRIIEEGNEVRSDE